MTTARDVIAEAIRDFGGEEADFPNYLINRLIAAPDSVRLELAALFNPKSKLPTIRCAVCDNGLEPDWIFCPWCAEPLSPPPPSRAPMIDIAALEAKLTSVKNDVAYKIGIGDDWRVIEKSTVEELLQAISRLAAPPPQDAPPNFPNYCCANQRSCTCFDWQMTRTAPPSEEIAGLIERSQMEAKKLEHYPPAYASLACLLFENAAALRSLAAEVERLKIEFDSAKERFRELEGERDAVRAMTIEECAAKIKELRGSEDTFFDQFLNGRLAAFDEADDAIHSLAQSEKKEP